MNPSMSNPFDERNTRFVARVRNHPGKPDSARGKSGSPQTKRRLFNDNQNYCCIPNPKNNCIYLSDTSFSGRFLNNQNMAKEDMKNKFLLVENPEIYAFDKVYSETCK